MPITAPSILLTVTLPLLTVRKYLQTHMEKIRFIITVVELHIVLSYNEHIECQQSYLVFL